MMIKTAKQMHKAAVRLAGSCAKDGSGGQVSADYQKGWRAASRCIRRTLQMADDYQPQVKL